MMPIYDCNIIAEMSREQNLRNLCRRLEYEYVTLARRATHGGYCLSVQWPAIGELGRCGVDGVAVKFVTTRKRTILVQDAQGNTHGEVAMLAGMAVRLYELAGEIVDKGETAS